MGTQHSALLTTNDDKYDPPAPPSHQHLLSQYWRSRAAANTHAEHIAESLAMNQDGQDDQGPWDAERSKEVELHNPNMTDDEENDYEEIDDEKLDQLENAASNPSTDNNEPTNYNNEVDDDDEDDDDDDDDDDVAVAPLEGSYDPSEYDALSVDVETRELFSVIMKYTPQTVELDHKFKPFIPDFIPAVGDIDAFIRPTRPDQKDQVRSMMVTWLYILLALDLMIF